MKYFSLKRTNGDLNSKFKGVETPSQKRFVEYYARILDEHFGFMPPQRSLKLNKIVLSSSLLKPATKKADWRIKVYSDNNKILKPIDLRTGLNCHCLPAAKSEEEVCCNDKLAINVTDVQNLINEIRIEFCTNDENLPRSHRNCAFFATIHASFIDERTNFMLKLGIDDLDNLSDNSQMADIYGNDFSVELHFQDSLDDELIETVV
jgi:PTEN phosphatase family protein